MLEGELEVLRPRPPPDAAYIDIGALRSRHAALSRIVPGGTGDDDAELETAYRNGAKTVLLRRTRGGVRVNDVEVAHSDLYDGDLIEIGDARLRFNWVGHERPVESNDGLA